MNLVPCSVFRNLLILLFSGCLNGKRIQNKTQTVRSFSGVMADKCTEEKMDETSLPVGKELSEANPNDKKRKRVYSVGDQGRCLKQKSKKVYSKGKTYNAPYSKNKKKMSTIIKVPENNTAEKRAVEGYRLIDMTILATWIGELSWPEC